MLLPILDLDKVSHNSANFQARTSIFFKVVNLKEKDDSDKEDNNNDNNVNKDDKRDNNDEGDKGI